jgi:hypothetical protein
MTYSFSGPLDFPKVKGVLKADAVEARRAREQATFMVFL